MMIWETAAALLLAAGAAAPAQSAPAPQDDLYVVPESQIDCFLKQLVNTSEDELKIVRPVDFTCESSKLAGPNPQPVPPNPPIESLILTPEQAVCLRQKFTVDRGFLKVQLADCSVPPPSRRSSK